MVKIGIIGCGGIANLHMDMLAKLKDRVQIIAVCDLDEKKAIAAKEKTCAKKHFTDMQEMLKLDINAILCCVPTLYHAKVVIDAAKSGKHIFCEKPIAMTLADADNMIEVCKKAGVVFQVGFVRRFDEEWLKFRELVQSGVIGRPVIWRSAAGSHVPIKWFIDEKIGGGPFIDGCVHNFDFALFTFGEAQLAVASLKKFRSDTTALDTGTAVVKFKSGDELMLSWSWGLPAQCHGSTLHDALGPAGAIIFPSGGNPEDKFMEFKIFNEKEKDKAEKVARDSIFKAFYKQMEHFIDCVENKKEPIVTGEDGKKAIAIALAVIQSAKTGKPVVIGK